MHIIILLRQTGLSLDKTMYQMHSATYTSTGSTRSASQFHKCDGRDGIKLSQFVEKICEITPVKLLRTLPFPCLQEACILICSISRGKAPALQGRAVVTAQLVISPQACILQTRKLGGLFGCRTRPQLLITFTGNKSGISISICLALGEFHSLFTCFRNNQGEVFFNWLLYTS